MAAEKEKIDERKAKREHNEKSRHERKAIEDKRNTDFMTRLHRKGEKQQNATRSGLGKLHPPAEKSKGGK